MPRKQLCRSALQAQDAHSDPWPFEMLKEQHVLCYTYLYIVTSVECLQIKLPVWLSSPEAQVDGVVSVEPRNGIVIGNCCYLHMRTN